MLIPYDFQDGDQYKDPNVISLILVLASFTLLYRDSKPCKMCINGFRKVRVANVRLAYLVNVFPFRWEVMGSALIWWCNLIRVVVVGIVCC